MLGAGRELTPDVDRQLADAFLRALKRTEEPEIHQPHYSLRIAGGVWGAALMFLLCAIIWARPPADQFLIVAVVLLTLVALSTRTFLYLTRHARRLPQVRIVLPPANGVEEGRG
jgi:hypothetical protein